MFLMPMHREGKGVEGRYGLLARVAPDIAVVGSSTVNVGPRQTIALLAIIVASGQCPQLSRSTQDQSVGMCSA